MATIGSPLNLSGILSTTRRIIHSHSRHFLALSLLFLLPISFSLFTLPTLSLSSPHHQTLLRQTPKSHHQTLAIPFILFLFLLLLLLQLSATATITRSTHHALHNLPVNLHSSPKTLLSTFLPLLATTALHHSLLALFISAFAAFPFLVTKALQTLLGFDDISYASNPYFLTLSGAVFTLLVVALAHIQASWALASVVVVVESKWGLDPLRRSAQLMEGMKLVFLSLWALVGAMITVFVWVFSPVANSDFGNVWSCLTFVSHTVVGSGCVTLVMLYSVASHVVLYMSCKALHGEWAWEIAEEFGQEYVSLPIDHAKVPHVVFVAPQA